MKNRIDTSRNKTPWDNCETITVVEEFVKNKYKENYLIKHPKILATEESKILNSIDIEQCRFCASKDIKKNGKNDNNVQIYFFYYTRYEKMFQ